MEDDFWPDPNPNRSIEHSGESSSDGGGYRFVFYGNQKGGDRKKKSDKKGKLIEAPVKLELSDDTLAEEIVEVHSEESVKQKVEELGDKIKECEHHDEDVDADESFECGKGNEK